MVKPLKLKFRLDYFLIARHL